MTTPREEVAKLIVCGGRQFNDRLFLYHVLDWYASIRPDAAIVSGMARGADSLAADWCRSRNHPLIAMPAQWDRHGRSAGYQRNRLMAQLPRVIGIIAFPGGSGTRHMTDLGHQFCIPVYYPSPSDLSS